MGRIRTTIAAVGLSLGLVGNVGAQDKIKLGSTPSAETVSVYAAIEEGIFAKHNLDVEFVTLPLNSTTPQAIVAGSLQIGGLTPPVQIQAAAGGLDVVIVSGASVTDPSTAKNFGIVVGANSDIAKAEDFVGKKVGVPGLGAFLDILFRRWLKENGVDLNSVTFIEVSFPNMNDVLKGGSVDAVVSADPFITRIVAAGTGEVLAGYELPMGQSIAYLSSTREWADANPDIVKRFRESISEAAEFVKSNPDKAREHISRYTKLPMEVVTTLAVPVTDPVVTEERLRWWVDVMREQGLVQDELDVASQIVK